MIEGRIEFPLFIETFLFVFYKEAGCILFMGWYGGHNYEAGVGVRLFSHVLCWPAEVRAEHRPSREWV